MSQDAQGVLHREEFRLQVLKLLFSFPLLMNSPCFRDDRSSFGLASAQSWGGVCLDGTRARRIEGISELYGNNGRQIHLFVHNGVESGKNRGR